jgi:hypothetical protein
MPNASVTTGPSMPSTTATYYGAKPKPKPKKAKKTKKK